MNWWLVGSGVCLLGAGIQAGLVGKYWFTGMYTCYFVATLCILMAEVQAK